MADRGDGAAARKRKGAGERKGKGSPGKRKEARRMFKGERIPGEKGRLEMA
jgi:hypothetical protein